MNIITKLNIRQKIMLGLTLLAALFLGWQVYNFVHSQTKAAAPATIPNANSANATATPAAVASTNSNAPANVATLPPPQAVNHLPPDVATNPYVEMEQRQYLDLVRQYQLTKMKRQILEEEANAANAQKTIADAAKNQNYQTGNAAFSSYAPVRTGYQLAYLDRQAGQWVATLNQNGQYIEVREGTTLSNGWQVISITRSGVVLSNGERQRNLGFEGSENSDISQGSYAISNQNPPENLPVSPQAVQVKNIAQALGITPGVPAAPTPAVAVVPSVSGVPAAKGVALPNNNNLAIKPQSAKTAAEVVQDVPAAPLATAPAAPAAAPVAPAATPAVKPVVSNTKPVMQPPVTVAAQPAPKPAVQPVTTTTVPVQNTDKSKNIFTTTHKNTVSTNTVNTNSASVNATANVNANQKPKTTLNQKIMEKAPLPASVKNIAGPVDQAPVNDAIIPAPTTSNNNTGATNTNTNTNSVLPAPEVSAAAEVSANQQTGKAVNVKALQQAGSN